MAHGKLLEWPGMADFYSVLWVVRMDGLLMDYSPVEDKRIDEVRGLLLGHANNMPSHIAALLKQAEAQLRYFQQDRALRELKAKGSS